MSVSHSLHDLSLRKANQLQKPELSMSDDSPGVPQDFDPAATPGSGMKIIAALVRKIGGEMRIGKGEQSQGTRFAVLLQSTDRTSSGRRDAQ